MPKSDGGTFSKFLLKVHDVLTSGYNSIKNKECFVYKEYTDSEAYGTELIKVFADRNRAVSYLQYRVKTCFDIDINTPWSEVEAMLHLNDDDIFDEDYVSLDCAKGVSFWIVEDHKIN